jgi:hypothetical protein
MRVNWGRQPWGPLASDYKTTSRIQKLWIGSPLFLFEKEEQEEEDEEQTTFSALLIASVDTRGNRASVK